MEEFIAALIVMVGLVVVKKIHNADRRRIALLHRGTKTTGILIKLKPYKTGSWNKSNKGNKYQGIYEFKDIRGNKYTTIEMVYEFKGKHGEVAQELAKELTKEVVYLDNQPRISRIYEEVTEEGMPSIRKLSLMIIMIVGILTVATLLMVK